MLKGFVGHHIVRSAFTTTVWNVFGRTLGFLIPFFIAAWFGVDSKTDVFFFVYGIVIYLTDIFSASLENNVVPFIAKIRSGKAEEVPVFISKLLSIALLAMVTIGIFMILAGRPILGIITNFPLSSQVLLSRLIVEVSPLFIFLVLSGILAGLLNAYSRFWLPAVSTGIRAIICLFTIFLLKNKIGIHSVALGYVIGEMVRLALFAYVLHRSRIFSFRFDIKITPEMLNFFRILSFQMISMMAVGMNPIVDKAMASWLAVGSVSILQYAQRLYFIPVILITSGSMVVLLTRWSEGYHKHNSIDVLKTDVYKAVGAMAVICAVIALPLFLLSAQAVDFAYARGKFPPELLNTVRITFLCYLAGFIFYILGQLFVRAHLVKKDTKTLMKTALISNAVNIIFNLVFMHFWGVAGIALSTSVTAALTLGYLFWSFEIRSKQEAAYNGK